MSNNFPNLPPGQDQDEEAANYLPIFLIIIPLIEVALFAIAGYRLGLAAGGLIGWAKLSLLSGGAYLVAYAIYRMAIEKGTLLYIKGSVAALVLSGLSIGLVGSTFFTATSAGLMISKFEEANLSEFVQDVGPYFDGRIAVAQQSAELAPILHAMSQNLSSQMDTEGDSGIGPIFRALEGLFNRTDGLLQQITVSLAVQQEVLERIAALRRAMEDTLADEGRNIWNRRADLRRQYSQMQSLLVELDKAIPVSLVHSFSAELGGGVLIPNREDATARINHNLNGFAANLTEALAVQKGVAGDPPAFPDKAGALGTFKHAGRNLPIVMVAFIVDILFPVALWGFATLTMVHIDREQNPDRWAKKRRAARDVDTITRMPPRSIPRPEDGPDQGDEELPPSSPRPPHRKPQRPSNKSRR